MSNPTPEDDPILSQLKIVSDEPSPNSDLFDFGTFSKQLGNILLDPNLTTPFVIGLDGEWGSGKTTLLLKTYNYVQEKKSDQYHLIWFDAWKFEKYDSVLALYFHIVEKLRGLSDSISDSLIGTGTFFLDMLSRKSTGMSLDEIRANYSNSLTNFSTISDNLMKAIGGKGRLIVFIDDLDRCENDQILELLFSIKEILNCKNIVFILGIDMKKIERAWDIKHRGYDEAILEGKEHIDKLFQLKIPLPRKRTIQLSNYINTLMKLPDTYGDMISEGTKRNPRKIKHTLNLIYFMVKSLDPEMQISKFFPEIVISAILSTSHPEILKKVRESPLFLYQASYICYQAGTFDVLTNHADNFNANIPTRSTMRLKEHSAEISDTIQTPQCIQIIRATLKDESIFDFLVHLGKNLEMKDQFNEEVLEPHLARLQLVLLKMPFLT